MTCLLSRRTYNNEKENYDHPNTATPKICPSCADITGRCSMCGKLKDNRGIVYGQKKKK